MKTALLPLLVAAPFTLALAAELPPQNIRQDVARLTLLPGPHLTSPSKHAPLPFAGETSIATEMKFISSTRDDPQRHGAAKPAEFAPAPKPQPPADPGALRFDEKLPATTKPLVAPKRN